MSSKSLVDILPLSPLQEGLFFHAQLAGPGADVYTVQLVLSLTGPVDAARMREAVSALLIRYPNLRAGFRLRPSGAPVQFLPHEVSLPWFEADLTGPGPQALAELLTAERAHRFDLSRPPLLRATLIKMGAGEFRLLLNFHHILLDGWSLSVLLAELQVCYSDGLAALAPPPAYRDYLVWLAGQDREEAKRAWTLALAGLAEPTLIAPVSPAAGEGGNGPAHQGLAQRIFLDLGRELSDALSALASARGITLSTVIQGAWALLLGGLTGRSDVVFGITTAGRPPELADVERMVGLFINTLPVRVRADPGEPAGKFLVRLQEEQNALLPYQHLGLAEIQSVTGLRTIFDTALVFENYPEAELRADDGQAAVRFAGVDGVDSVHYPAALAVIPGRTLVFRFDLRAEDFSAGQAELLRDRFKHLIDQIAQDPDAPVSRLVIATAPETERQRAANATSVDGPRGGLPELFAAQVARTPGRVAVVSGETGLTYAELDARAERLARRLRAAGIGPESRVALLLDRSADLVTAVVGVAKSGGTYVPLHHDDPTARLRHILAIAAPVLLLTDTAQREHPLLRAADTLDFGVLRAADAWESADDPPSAELGRLPKAHEEQLAYVMFTSGSTGIPSGVAITHRAVVAMVSDRCWGDLSEQRILMHTPAGFDPATYELWAPLLTGGQIVVAPPGPVEPAVIAGLAARAGLTSIMLAAGLFRVLAEEAPSCFAGLAEVSTGGDVISPAAVGAVLRACPDLTLRTMYGPTEGTLCATQRQVRADLAIGSTMPIGVPMDNMAGHVLDAWLRPVPDGTVGELYLGGTGLARGYLGRPGLTAGRFVADPRGAPGARLFRTGDLARLTEEGLLEFAGRSDDQIKIRGFRVEPGEVEAVLARHPRVAAAAVVVRDDGPRGNHLVAYPVLAEGSHLSAELIRSYLAEQLPEHMVPVVVPLPALPVTRNGKLDRSALPAPQAPGSQASRRAPGTPLEEIIADLFAEVLGLPAVGVDEDFFSLGGHSLMAVRLIGRAQAVLGLDPGIGTLFLAPTASAFAERTRLLLTGPSPAGTRPSLTAGQRPDIVPLSDAQQRLWFVNQAGDGPMYHIPVLLRLTGALDVGALAAALNDIVARHEALRTLFNEYQGQPRQVILDRAVLALSQADLTGSQLAASAREFAARPFDLATEIPIRAWLARTGQDQHSLVLVLHHIAADGGSFQPLFDDLAAAYSARIAGNPPAWRPLGIQYADYALWRNAVLDSADSLHSADADYWRAHLAGQPARLPLPVDRRYGDQADPRSGSVPIDWPASLQAGIRALARKQGLTVFMVLHAALAALLWRLGAGPDISIGTAIEGRTKEQLRTLVGLFVNTLVLRVDAGDDPEFAELLRRVREVDLAAYAHSDLPFDRLVELVNPHRSSEYHPLCQVMLMLQGQSVEAPELPGLGVVLDPVDLAMAKYELLLTLNEQIAPDGSPAGLTGSLDYAAALFDEHTARAIVDRLGRLLDHVTASPRERLSKIDLGTARERQLVRDWGAPDPEALEAGLAEGTPGTLGALFERQAARTPQATAVVFDGVRTSYAELDTAASAIALRLRQAGVGPDDLVALALPRSLTLVAAIIGVLKAGGAYLPLDPDYPAERLGYMLADAKPRCVLVDDGELTSEIARLCETAGVPVLMTDTADQAPASGASADAGARPENAAYVIYTSGSTGRPKGVIVTHGNVIRLFEATSRQFGFGPADVWTLFHSYAFDFSVWELWGALLYGGTLVVVPFTVSRSPGDFLELLARERVTVLNQTPSAFYQLIRADSEAARAPALALRWVIFGGEALDAGQVDLWYERHPDDAPALVNMYGITETTVFVTQLAMTRDLPGRLGGSLIGRGLADLRVQLLDENLGLVPPGLPGEIYVSGPGLARGYLRQPGLTAHRFVADPAGVQGERMYRSGDIARWRHDGTLEFIGRADDQIKIRGFRVELGEVTAALAETPGVGQAVVIVREDTPGDRHLVGYVVPAAGAAPQPEELREALRARLPGYMIPAAIALLPAVPLTVNGKLDVAALPVPWPATGERAGRGLPRDERERQLAAIFADVLGVQEVGLDDDFFALGGHSLLAVRFIGQVQALLGAELDIAVLFDHPTVAGLSPRLDDAPPARALPPLRRAVRPGTGSSSL